MGINGLLKESPRYLETGKDFYGLKWRWRKVLRTVWLKLMRAGVLMGDF